MAVADRSAEPPGHQAGGRGLLAPDAAPEAPPPPRARRRRAQLRAAGAAVRRRLRELPRPLLVALLAVALAGGLVAADGLGQRGRIRRGVRVGGVDLSWLTPAAAEARLAAAATAVQARPLQLSAAGATASVPRSRAGLQLDVAASAAAALAVGRRGMLDGDRLRSWFGGVDLPWQARVLREPLERELAALDARIGRRVREPALRIAAAAGPDGAIPVELVPGRPGRVIEREGAAAALLAAAAAPAGAPVPLPVAERPPTVEAAAARGAAELAGALLSAPVQVTAAGSSAELRPADLAPLLRSSVRAGELAVRLDPGPLDRLLRRLAPFAYAPARDAGFQPAGQRISVVPAVVGRRVNPGRAAAALLAAGRLEGEARLAALPTVATQPALTTRAAEGLGVKEVTSSFTTTFNAGDIPRVHNIGLIAEAVDGSLVRPGETFSMNAATGERTAAKGYRTAHVIRNSEIVDGLGGGVCQAGTTMFNAVFFAGLPVLERRNHSLHLNQYPMGRDATLNWPGTDLSFRNDSPHGIYITGRATASTLTFTLWSTSRGYKVSFATSAASNFRDPPTRYEDDPALPKGEEVVEEAGSSGFDVTVSRTVTRDGQTVRRDQFVSVYRPWTRVVRRGTGKADPTAPQAPGGSP
ncbi:MAG TPA: VanW family protein [Actinomycetota bacterium]|nr:VanW family protein [Actinomycetota bacterium]